MYLFKVEIKESKVEGKGVFTLEKIKKGNVVWKFESKYDLKISQEEFKKLNKDKKRKFEKVCYLSSISKMWICPPENDPACFTNHSSSINNLSVVFDSKISPEPFFEANRNISVGEELIVNYLEFDEFIQKTKPKWTREF